jgi:hypothetical protein
MQILEPMLDHNLSTIASGAIPIGSANHAPDEKKLTTKTSRSKLLSPLSVAKTRYMNLTFTPIGRITCASTNIIKNPTILGILTTKQGA